MIAVEDGFDLLCAAPLCAGLKARMQMYVLRADVRIEAPPDTTVLALVDDVDDALHDMGTDMHVAAGAVVEAGDTRWLRVSESLAFGYTEGDVEPASNDDTRVALAEIRAGRPRLGTTTTGQFTAHMLNLDRLGAISFNKGCYPGQEIVARTHNLGTPKRRLFGFRADSETLPAPGDTIEKPDGKDGGTIVSAAHSTDGIELLAVIRVDDAGSQFRLGQSGPLLQRFGEPL